ncbi:hypothetical protein SDC9_165688 [bioreactor metagenome]|uniref:Uncharacterized protein n=1 Tax=bioreactor metagenome TaxID=1076179 RepID=A0A645FUY1_9ZZZZ
MLFEVVNGGIYIRLMLYPNADMVGAIGIIVIFSFFGYRSKPQAHLVLPGHSQYIGIIIMDIPA